MSLKALTWAKSQKVGDPIAKLVLMCLADATNERDGFCFPSQKRLAGECECSRQTINKKLSDLEAKGFIRRERVTDEQGRDTASRYHLLGVNEGDTGVNDVDRGVSTTATGGVNEGDTSKENRKKNRKKEPLTPIVPLADFDTFWKAYPRKVAIGAARTAWAKAVKKAAPAEIIDAASRYRPPDKKFTKHPATWLNQECWTDEPDHHDEPEDPFFAALRKNLAGDSDLRGGADMGEADSGDTGADDGVGSGHPRLTLISGTCGQADNFEVAGTGQGFDGLEGQERHGMGDCPGGDVFAVGRNAR